MLRYKKSLFLIFFNKKILKIKKEEEMGRSSGVQQNKHHMQPEMSLDIGVLTSFFAIASCNSGCGKTDRNSQTDPNSPIFIHNPFL